MPGALDGERQREMAPGRQSRQSIYRLIASLFSVIERQAHSAQPRPFAIRSLANALPLNENDRSWGPPAPYRPANIKLLLLSPLHATFAPVLAVLRLVVIVVVVVLSMGMDGEPTCSIAPNKIKNQPSQITYPSATGQLQLQNDSLLPRKVFRGGAGFAHMSTPLAGREAPL